MNSLRLDPLSIILLVLLVVAVPLLARREMARLKRAAAAGIRNYRLVFYRRTIITQWLAAGILLGVWLGMDRSLAAVGLRPEAHGWQWAAMAAAVLAAALLIASMRRVGRDPEQLAALHGQLGDLALMIPRTADERRGFDLLSVTAGVCEEFLYRGVLTASLAATMGLWPAVLLSSLVFGMGHAYQGPGGVLKTGGVGLVLALVVMGTGSLFTAMLLHAVLDMTQGGMASKACLAVDEQTGPSYA